MKLFSRCQKDSRDGACLIYNSASTDEVPLVSFVPSLIAWWLPNFLWCVSVYSVRLFLIYSFITFLSTFRPRNSRRCIWFLAFSIVLTTVLQSRLGWETVAGLRFTQWTSWMSRDMNPGLPGPSLPLWPAHHTGSLFTGVESLRWQGASTSSQLYSMSLAKAAGSLCWQTATSPGQEPWWKKRALSTV